MPSEVNPKFLHIHNLSIRYRASPKFTQTAFGAIDSMYLMPPKTSVFSSKMAAAASVAQLDEGRLLSGYQFARLANLRRKVFATLCLYLETARARVSRGECASLCTRRRERPSTGSANLGGRHLCMLGLCA